MKVLITGATGFIGSHIVKSLVSKGHKVRTLVRKSSDTSDIKGPGVDLAYGDITDPESLTVAVKGMDAVIHLAAMVSDFGPYKDFIALNIDGVKNILNAAKDEGVSRFVHFSTNDVLGIHKGGVLVNDSFPYKKTGYPYPDTKIEGEKIVFDYYEKFGLPVSVIRPSWVYGPGDRTFIPEVVDAMRTRMMIYFGDKKNTISLNYIDNLTDAVLLLLERPEAVGEAFIANDDHPVTWEWLVKKLADGLDLKLPKITLPFGLAMWIARVVEFVFKLLRIKSRPPLTTYAINICGSNMVYSASKMKDVLGYEPRVLPEEGMKRTIEWLLGEDLTKIKTK
jgi:nucleoside-diphosphate-sugar epimerase